MRRREAPSGFMPHPSAASGRTPAGGARRGPEKIISGYYAWNGRRCAESLVEGGRRNRSGRISGGRTTEGRVAKLGDERAAVTESTLGVCTALRTRR